MGLKSKYIEKLKEENHLVTLYTDKFNEHFFGYVLGESYDFMLFERYENDGSFAGITVLFNHDISRIRWGGNELNSISLLIDKSKRKKNINEINLTSIKSIIESFSALFGCVSVYAQGLGDSVFIGEIVEIDDDSLIIHEYGTKSQLERKHILIELDDVTKVEAAGEYEKSLEKIYNNLAIMDNIIRNISSK